MTTDELRAKFELWATVERRYNLERHPLRHDEYNYTSTDRAWEAWKASHASRDAEVEALKLDAERWRHFRRCLARGDDSAMVAMHDAIPDDAEDKPEIIEPMIDAGIDAATAKESGE